MLNAKSFLAVDFGAANLKLADFQLTEDGGLLLKRYGFKSLGQEGTQETTRQAAMQRALQELLAEGPYASKNINICAPGFHTFSKFVKLPPVDTSKVTQIIQYEAQQNVPFPLEEVVWDYQILGAAPTGELEVFLVAIKSDIVEGLFRVAEDTGLRLQLVDVSPAALCNAFRYNYSDLEGCSMLLDIGARTSNLLFFEKGNVYSRGISVGAHAITQEFAKEARLSFGEAEKLKIEEGFVSLGGAYEEPENPHQAAISKIARQVLTRLHIQVNQTIQFYRGQQGGSPPQRLFLSGGAAILPYTAQFFSEKLNLPGDAVEYFNPLRYVQLAPEINREELAKVAHNLGEVVGLGLRNLAHCPVELNLMPKSSLKRQQLSQRKPYFIASAGCLVMAVFAIGWFYDKVAAQKNQAIERRQAMIAPVQSQEQTLNNELRELKGAQIEAEQFVTWLEDRHYWGTLLMRLREALMTVEAKKEQELRTKTGVWIERFIPVLPQGIVAGAAGMPAVPPPDAFLTPPGEVPPPPPPQLGPGEAPPPPTISAPGPSGPRGRGGGRGSSFGRPASTHAAADVAISTVQLYCRGVNLTPALTALGNAQAASGNTDLADEVRKELQAMTDYFDPAGTALTGTIQVDPSDLTFTFEITAKLKRPVRIY